MAKSETHRARYRGGQSDARGASRDWRWNEGTVGRRKWRDLRGVGTPVRSQSPHSTARRERHVLWSRYCGTAGKPGGKPRTPTDSYRDVRRAAEKCGEQTRAEGRGVGRWKREVKGDAAQRHRTFASASSGSTRRRHASPEPVGLGGSINLDQTDVGGPGQRGPRRTMVESDG